MCRKVAMADNGGEIEIWGDGEQTRSFLYVDECIEATIRLTRSNWEGPVNIGSDEMITISQLAKTIMAIAGKELLIKHVDGPLGVRGRNSDNTLYEKKLNWRVSDSLAKGLELTYPWIAGQVVKHGKDLSI
jgi:nucleoside-diphosphate-sugar epimerase